MRLGLYRPERMRLELKPQNLVWRTVTFPARAFGSGACRVVESIVTVDTWIHSICLVLRSIFIPMREKAD